jgi:hypothetical protein
MPDDVHFGPRSRQHHLRISPPPFTPVVGPSVSGRWMGSRGEHHPSDRPSPEAYYAPSAYPIHGRPYAYQPYRYASDARYPADSPYSAHPTHSPYLHSPFRSSPTTFAHEYSRPPVFPSGHELPLSPASTIRQHSWADRDRTLPPPPSGPGFSRMPSGPYSPVHMNPIRPLPGPSSMHSKRDVSRSTAYNSEKDCDSNPSLPSPRTILSWGEADDRNDSSPSHHFKCPRQLPVKTWSPPLTEHRRSESPAIGLTTPPPSITSGSSISILRKRAISTSSAGSGGDFKRSRSAWWHTIEDTRFPEARYNVEDAVFNEVGASFMLSEPRPRSLRPVDAQRIPYLEHITQLDGDLVRLLNSTRRTSGDVIKVPAYLYR